MRDRAALYDAVRPRVEAFFDGADPNPLQGRAAARDAAALAKAADPETDVEAAYLLGSFHWYRHQTTFDDDIHPNALGPAIRPFAIAYQADPDFVPDTLHEYFAQALAEGKLPLNANAQAYRGRRLLARFEGTGDLRALTGSVEHFRCALAATAEGSPERSGRLGNLCVVLHLAAEQLGSDTLMAEAVETGRAAMALASNAEEHVITQFILATVSAEQYGGTDQRATHAIVMSE